MQDPDGQLSQLTCLALEQQQTSEVLKLPIACKLGHYGLMMMTSGNDEDTKTSWSIKLLVLPRD